MKRAICILLGVAAAVLAADSLLRAAEQTAEPLPVGALMRIGT